MGGSYSHIAHRDHPLRRARCETSKARCALCGDNVQFNGMAYCCTVAGCSSFLHDACYGYPERIKAKGHFSAGHSLALTARADVAATGGEYCTVCAKNLDGFSHVYSCSQGRHHGCAAGGFRAHPRCGNLPPQASAASHPHRLVLRAPTTDDGRTCLECKHHAGGGGQPPRAWSYQCLSCQGVELCLQCVLGGNGAAVHCCACDGGCFLSCAGMAGLAVGNFLDGFFQACIGFGFTPANAKRAG